MPDAGGGPNFVQEAAAVCRRQWHSAGRVPPLVRRHGRYDFGNRFEFGLNVIVDALTRSILDNLAITHLTGDRSVTTPKGLRRKPTLERSNRIRSAGG